MPVPTKETRAGQTLSRLGLYEKVAADADFGEWRARQRTVKVDGRLFYLVGGDRLADESELMLNWAVERRLADATAVAAAQREITDSDTPDDVDFLDLGDEETRNG